jgi:predicted metal-dependent phosphoesterase TrpH
MISRADTHVHTHYSGISNYKALRFPESVTKPEEQVEAARKNGMNLLCITDHDAIKGAFVAKEYAKKYDDFTVVIGEEITTADGEVLAYGLNELIPPELSIEETMDRIRSQDALAVAPHPYSFYLHCLKDRIKDLDLDGIETINGGHVDRFTNTKAQLVFTKNPGRWAALSGSDAHSTYTAGYNWTEFEGCGEEDFRHAILKKKTIPCGEPAPVITQVQWSIKVVTSAQGMMARALTGKLEADPDNPLITKIISLPVVKKVAGIIGGSLYLIPPIPYVGAFAATRWLERMSQRLLNQVEYKLEASNCPKPPIR